MYLPDRLCEKRDIYLKKIQNYEIITAMDIEVLENVSVSTVLMTIRQCLNDQFVKVGMTLLTKQAYERLMLEVASLMRNMYEKGINEFYIRNLAKYCIMSANRYRILYAIIREIIKRYNIKYIPERLIGNYLIKLDKETVEKLPQVKPYFIIEKVLCDATY